MAHDSKTRAFVRRYYVFDLLPLEQSAEKAGVSFATARRWKKQAEQQGDDWDKVREAHTLSGGKVEDVARGLLTAFVLYFGNVMEELKADNEMSVKDKAVLLSGLGDSFTKMTAASRKIMPEVSELACAMKTVKLLGEYIQQHKPQLLEAFLALLTDFGAVLEQEFK
ncbi:DUF1804 family protein [Volucribacter amazonae]|uniref:DNA-binding protein n=1 Tax=Volucribacter amazonae TaxID=256731 RepID=A0A9X4PCI2_9PAST|nr:DUF1804 family protein [Volucribacter amazonae]MDG6895051.1 DNA-binding protein [Volucribacter amazonae]